MMPGAPKAGPYDALHMNHPKGIAVDTNGRLWVTEDDFHPKRVSVWNPDGSLWKAWYGPSQYGGGGGGYSSRATTGTAVVCSGCGQQTTVPFEPRGDRPVFCRDCFQAQKGGSGGGGGRGRGGNDRGGGRGGRY